MSNRAIYAGLMACLSALLWGGPAHADAPVGDCPDGWVRFFEPDPELYPFESQCFVHALGTMHYVDEGPVDSDTVVLFVHGNPSWSILHQAPMQAMAEAGHRVVSLDQFGFGLSDKPHPDQYSYTPREQSQRLEELVVALDLQNITLVVHDWGGPIGLGMAGRQPDRIANILITNTWAWEVSVEAPGLYYAATAWATTAQDRGDFIRDTCFLPNNNAETVAMAYDPSQGALYDRVMATYRAPWFDPQTGEPRVEWACEPPVRMAQAILGDVAYLNEVEAGLAALVGKPYAMAFGQSDILFGELHFDRTLDTHCAAPYEPVCDPAMVAPGAACDDDLTSRGIMASPDAYVCRLDGAPVFPYIDRFQQLLGQDSVVSVYTAIFPRHFVAAYPDGQAIIEQALFDLIERPSTG